MIKEFTTNSSAPDIPPNANLGTVVEIEAGMVELQRIFILLYMNTSTLQEKFSELGLAPTNLCHLIYHDQLLKLSLFCFEKYQSILPLLKYYSVLSLSKDSDLKAIKDHIVEAIENLISFRTKSIQSRLLNDESAIDAVVIHKDPVIQSFIAAREMEINETGLESISMRMDAIVYFILHAFDDSFLRLLLPSCIRLLCTAIHFEEPEVGKASLDRLCNFSDEVVSRELVEVTIQNMLQDPCAYHPIPDYVDIFDDYLKADK